jgi:hypothetical protein
MLNLQKTIIAVILAALVGAIAIGVALTLPGLARTLLLAQAGHPLLFSGATLLLLIVSFTAFYLATRARK